MRKRDRNIAIGTVLAVGVGYVAGILTAPKSGKETRRDIQNAAIKAKKEAEIRLKTLSSELTDLISIAKQRAKTIAASSKQEFNLAIEKAQVAKEKVAEILSALHEGEADDNDLQQAIKDVNKAIDHLRTYLEKTDSK